MNEKTLKALQGSIEKWEGIACGASQDKGDKNCPLCALFLDAHDCYGCPVHAKTGKRCCDGSPYEKWIKVAWKRDHHPFATTPQEVRIAKAELKFLKGLLP